MAILEVIKRAKWRESTAVATKLIKVDNMDNHDSGSIAREPGPPFEDTRDCIFDRGVFDAGINSKETTDDIIIFLRRKGYAKARDQLACATSNDGSQERERVSSCLLHSYAGCASKETMEEIISQLEKHGLSFLINTPDEGGRRPLHCATTSANMGALEALANCSAVDVNACDINGQTPLVSAVLEDELKVVAQLCKGLPQFASELMPNLKDTFGRTALDYAVDGNLTTIEMELMKREDVKAYVDGFYKERQLYVDKVNAILGLSSAMTGLIIAGTFGALLNSASDSGADLLLRKDPAMTSATICSFIFSIGASVAAVMSYNPKRRIGATVVYIRGTSQVAFMMLLLAGVFFFFALTLAGINMR
ncbi:hypothetical protein L7F22_031875 [Adiantum nelumboides]|nr:hypothetical protein [Adiantum nelumboides]